MPKFGDRAVAFVRTLVASGVGAVLTYAAVHYNIVLSPDNSAVVIGAATGVASGAYAAAVNWLSSHLDKRTGYLLGVAKTPTYLDDDALAALYEIALQEAWQAVNEKWGIDGNHE